MTDPEFYAEAKRRTQKATPSLTDEQWRRWLEDALKNGGRLVLTLDGCLAAYEIKDAPTRHTAPAIGKDL